MRILTLAIFLWIAPPLSAAELKSNPPIPALPITAVSNAAAQGWRSAPWIETGTMADLRAIMMVERDSFFPFDWSTKEEWRKTLSDPKSRVMVVRHDKRIAAVIVYYIKNTRLYVDNLTVDPNSREHGLGTALLRHAISQAKANPAVRAVSLHVRVDNKAISIYRRLRFSIRKRERNFYSDGADAHYMELQLRRP